MASIKFPRKEFEKEIKLTRDVEDKISMLGTHLESVNENEIEIEVLPNRPDLFSMQGFIRTLKAFLGKETGLKKYKINPPEKNFRVKISKTVENIRPFTACAIVKGIKFDDSKIKEIIAIQEKLHATIGRNRKRAAIGIYPLEKITLPITYEARKPEEIKFIPLEMDRELTGQQILQKHPTGRENAHLLEGLSKYPVFIDGKGKILSMPPIINSNETGKITEKTTDVFIECSGFNLEIEKKILNIIVTTLAEMGGKIYLMNLEYDKTITTPNLTPEKIKLSLTNTNKLLGLNLKEKDLENLIPKMGYDYSKGSVSVPAWRSDVLHEVDIIEDIAIAYGYDNFHPEIPSVSTIAEESKESRIDSKISEILIGLGLLEISTYHLVKSEEIKNLEEIRKIEVENSKTEFKFLRPNLTISGLRIFSENKDNEYPQKIFEIGNVFEKDKKSETGIKENKNLIIASSPSNFTEIKQILDCLLKTLSINYSLEESTNKYFVEGRTGLIKIEDKGIGFIGEIHPNVLNNWGIKMPVSIIEISLEEIYSHLCK